MTKKLIHGFAAMLALLTAACVSVLPEAAPPKPRFHIAAADADALTGEALPFSLVVDDPRATRVYDSVRIAVATAPGRIAYLGGAEWADRAPRLFQTALVQTFEDAGRILAVGDRSAVPVADLVLQTDIRRMEVDVENADAAVVSVYARLTNGKGTVYAAKKFDARASAASTEPDDVYDAFNGAFNEVISGIVEWTFETGQAERANS
ncbi:ABC-type transport auxiliary lipoprotein family protein [Hyphococcus sp.]|jgi:cholesterol transport system auxiliary component|uniref:ABC-type transport auxiliary lipoprotein family protein n=1 Tax=Hyphococcus sp. TaxID=2038636 RepID=UPI003D105AF8